MSHWALIIGVNQYDHFQPLNFAKQDAKALWELLVNDCQLSRLRCVLLTETAPALGRRSPQPNRQTLLSWVEWLANQPLQPDDTVWVFFSGYGICHHGIDYLMPLDGHPDTPETTGIPIAQLLAELSELPARSLLLLDLHRSHDFTPDQEVGLRTAQLAQDYGIATLLSCQPGQFSRESVSLRHGFFTIALIDSLRERLLHPPMGTLQTLTEAIGHRMAELCEHHWRPLQKAHLVATPDQQQSPVLPPLIPLLALAGNPESTQNWSHSPLEMKTASDTVLTVERSHLPFTVPATLRSFTLDSSDGTYIESLLDDGDPEESALNPEEAWKQMSQANSWATDDRGIGLWMWLGGGAIALLVLTALWHTQSMKSPDGPSAPSPQQNSQFTPSATPSATLSATPSATLSATPSATPQTAASTPSATPQTAFPSPNSQLAILREPLTAQATEQPQPPPLSNSLLERARFKTLIKSTQATPFHTAIVEAAKIPADHPEYAAAQRAITEWSGEIWTIARQRAKARQFNPAILAAQLIPPNQAISTTVKPAIAQWCQQRDRNSHPTIRQRAQTICRTMAQNGKG